jgi:alpha-L-fucosidase
MGTFDGQDPQYQDLYGVPWPSSNPGYEKMKDVAPPAWEDLFEKRMIDLVDKYHPDLYYTDGGIPFKHAGLDILSHFYNANQRWNNGKLEAVATIKVDYVENIAVQDYEFASSSSLATYPFIRISRLTMDGSGPRVRRLVIKKQTWSSLTWWILSAKTAASA